MVRVRRSVKQKVMAAAAVAALLAGASLAAVSATGQSSPHRRAGSHGGFHDGGAFHHGAFGGRARDLAAAAAYLGVSQAQLSAALSSGKTLAQVADATSGKSAAGLTQTLLAMHRARLTAALARLPQRVAAEVNRAGGPGEGGRLAAPRTGAARLTALFAAPGGPGAVAAGYLGVAPAQLQARLRSGKTLAQVADATAGKSTAGLVDALVAARRAKLARATAAGRLSQARQAKRESKLQKRMNALVQRQFAGAGSP
jgi:hypothetical protein